MEKRIKFQVPKDITAPDLDGVAILFPFTVVDASLLGKPEEERNIKLHRLIVEISRCRLSSWDFKKQVIIKLRNAEAKGFRSELDILYARQYHTRNLWNGPSRSCASPWPSRETIARRVR